MDHYIHYIKREIVFPPQIGNTDEPPYIEPAAPNRGINSPVFHSLSLNSIAARMQVGDIIWLFSQLNSPWGKLPPSLDAKIEIAEIDKGQKLTGRYRLGAGSSSQWFPLKDATTVLKKLKCVNTKNEVSPLLTENNRTVGQAARIARKLHRNNPLPGFGESISNQQIDFISYRIADGTESAFKLAQSLLREKRVVFWDRWTLPRRLSERNEHIDPAALDSRISSMIRSSRVVWGVLSEKYARDDSYSALEKRLATEVGIYRPYANE